MTPSTSRSSREGHVAPSASRFAWFAAQLLGLLGVMAFVLPQSLATGVLVVAGFLAHYWLPLAWKPRAWIALGVLALFLHLPPRSVALFVPLALLPWCIVRAPIAFAARIALLFALAALVAVGSRALDPWLGGRGAGGQLATVFGAAFAIRTWMYLHHVRHAKTAPRLTDYLAYFVAPPTIGEMLPLVDYHAMIHGSLRRDANAIVQLGIHRIALGLGQVAIWRAVVHVAPFDEPDRVHSPGGLLLFLIEGYLRLLYYGGIGHLLVGMYQLFGYDLPALNRDYGLAEGPLDFWRRNNVYLKDMMVKLVFMPAYFRVSRKSGPRRAQLVATALVFASIAVIEPWARGWMSGWLDPWPTYSRPAFRVAFGLACVLDAWAGGGDTRRVPAPWWRRAPRIVGTMVLVAVLLQLEWLGSAHALLQVVRAGL